MPTNPNRLDFTSGRRSRPDRDREIDRLNAECRVMVEQSRGLEERTK